MSYENAGRDRDPPVKVLGNFSETGHQTPHNTHDAHGGKLKKNPKSSAGMLFQYFTDF